MTYDSATTQRVGSLHGIESVEKHLIEVSVSPGLSEETYYPTEHQSALKDED
jgi:hypothetical protein